MMVSLLMLLHDVWWIWELSRKECLCYEYGAQGQEGTLLLTLGCSVFKLNIVWKIAFQLDTALPIQIVVRDVILVFLFYPFSLVSRIARFSVWPWQCVNGFSLYGLILFPSTSRSYFPPLCPSWLYWVLGKHLWWIPVFLWLNLYILGTVQCTKRS